MAEEGFLGFASRMASTLMGGAPDGPRFAWHAIAPWFSELSRNAATLWLPHLVHGIPCEVVQRDPATGGVIACKGSAIAGCEICRKPCCLDHSFVQKQCAAVCYACVYSVARAKIGHDAANGADAGGTPRPGAGRTGSGAPRSPAAADPIDPRFAEARKVLGIKKSATWNEIEARYKELLRKHHPDRNPADKAAAERRFKAVRSAYDFLKLSQTESPP